MSDQEIDSYIKLSKKYGPMFETMKKTWSLISLHRHCSDDRLLTILQDDIASYERFRTILSAWGFFEAMLSIPQHAALEIMALANEDPED